MTSAQGIREVDLEHADLEIYEKRFADCIVLSAAGELVLQQKPKYWDRFPGYLMAFGGHVEEGETIIQGLCREIKEELGGEINPAEIVFIGAVSESFSDHSEIVHVYFWHDEAGTITGCYEGDVQTYQTAGEALEHPKVMDYLRWALQKCVDKGFVPQ